MLPSATSPASPEEATLSRQNPACRPTALRPSRPVIPGQVLAATPPTPAPSARPLERRGGLDGFNAASPQAAETALLACCGSRRWALRMTEYRPYPDLASLLAAADEASYDLTTADVAEALALESPTPDPLLGLGSASERAARTALRAAHDAYQLRFLHAFVLCVDDFGPDEVLDQTLAALRRRLGNEPEEERTIAADELRRTARGRLLRLVAPRSAPRR